MRQLSGYVLMPFAASFTFVYEYGLRPAFEQAEIADTPLTRADQHLELQGDKIPEVMNRIRAADFVVFDITGNNPNVLWELGFARALDKHAFVLTQATDNLPFNVRGLDVVTYTASVDGLKQLNDALAAKLREALPQILKYRGALAFEQEIVDLQQKLGSALLRIPKESIVRNLARNELKRLADRIDGLPWQFELRNQKPNSEIIDYFEDYISQLTSSDSRFDTVTHLGFWREISEQGGNYKYLMANHRAAAAGAHIRRVFFIDAKECEDGVRVRDPASREILTQYYEFARGPFKGSISTHIVHSHTYDADCLAYENFGLLEKGPERLLFRPAYSRAGTMEKTNFNYYNPNEARCQERYKELIEKYGRNFEAAFKRGVLLTPQHLEAPRSTPDAEQVFAN